MISKLFEKLNFWFTGKPTQEMLDNSMAGKARVLMNSEEYKSGIGMIWDSKSEQWCVITSWESGPAICEE